MLDGLVALFDSWVATPSADSKARRSLGWQYARVNAALRQAGRDAAHHLATSVWPTAQALLATAVLAAVGPAALWLAGWRLGHLAAGSEFLLALARGLERSALFLATVNFTRHLCRTHGLGEAHFGWPPPVLDLIRRSLWWLTAAGLPLAGIVLMTDAQSDDAIKNSLGRAAFVGFQVILLVSAYRVWHAPQGLARQLRGDEGNRWWLRLCRIGHVVSILAPVGLAALAIAGYYYTAVQLAQRLLVTSWLVGGLLVLHATLLRWVLLAYRDLAIKRGREQQAARFVRDGLLVVKDGLIEDFGPHAEVAPRHPGLAVTHLPNRLILPGFIDGHIHFPQVRVLGAYGNQLLDWLQRWIFPEELKYSDRGYAREAAGRSLVVAAGGAVLLELIASVAHRWPFGMQRVSVFLLPLLYILMAIGAVRLARLAAGHVPARLVWWRYAALGIGAVALAVAGATAGVATSRALAQTIQLQYQPAPGSGYQAAAARARTLAAPGDVVVIESGEAWYGDAWLYYMDKYQGWTGAVAARPPIPAARTLAVFYVTPRAVARFLAAHPGSPEVFLLEYAVPGATFPR